MQKKKKAYREKKGFPFYIFRVILIVKKITKTKIYHLLLYACEDNNRKHNVSCPFELL